MQVGIRNRDAVAPGRQRAGVARAFDRVVRNRARESGAGSTDQAVRDRDRRCADRSETDNSLPDDAESARIVTLLSNVEPDAGLAIAMAPPVGAWLPVNVELRTVKSPPLI
jgi:hypothetical protein